MDPLSISASIIAIVGAARHVYGVITQIADAPEELQSLRNEVHHVEIIFSALQKFVTNVDQRSSSRVSLIQIDDIVIILTQTVLVFSKLQPHVESLLKAGRVSRHLRWPTASSAITKHVDQLQRNKASLSLVLQIMQCDTLLQAQTSADTLHQSVVHQAQNDSDVARRIERIQNDTNSVYGSSNDQPDSTDNTPDDSASMTTVKANSRPVATSTEEEQSNEDMNHTVHESFDRILRASRPYARVENRLVDDAHTTLSARSRPWSALSYWSLGELSTVAVVSLPLNDAELESFQRLVHASQELSEKKSAAAGLDVLTPPLDVGKSHLSGSNRVTQVGLRDLGRQEMSYAAKRLRKELLGIERDPPPYVAAGPMDDDMGCILALPETPYAGGAFLLDINIPNNYPFKAPQVRFLTKIYHPNIDSNGLIDLDLLGHNWYPSMSITKVLLCINAFLGAPNPDAGCALMPDIALIYRNDRARFEQTAHEWTRKYAH